MFCDVRDIVHSVSVDKLTLCSVMFMTEFSLIELSVCVVACVTGSVTVCYVQSVSLLQTVYVTESQSLCYTVYVLHSVCYIECVLQCLCLCYRICLCYNVCSTEYAPLLQSLCLFQCVYMLYNRCPCYKVCVCVTEYMSVAESVSVEYVYVTESVLHGLCMWQSMYYIFCVT